MKPAYHVIVVSLVTGLFFFAVLAVVVRALLQWRKMGDRPLATYADRAAVGAAVIAIVLTVIGIITGFLQWPLEATLRSSLMRNKILASFLVLAFWGMFLIVRLRRGADLWRSPVMTVYVTLLALSGFAFGMITNSIGGDVAGNPSGFENIVEIFGVETRYTFYLPTWLNLAIIVGGIALIAMTFIGTTSDTTTATEPASTDGVSVG